MLKRFLCSIISVLMILGMFTACGEQAEEPTTPTEPAQEAKALKILTLGHSLTVDSCHMLNLVCATEGIGEYEEVKIGTLYYSGCQLWRHVQFLQNNSKEYNLYVSSSKTPDKVPEILQGFSMEDALRFDYWDIIIMQGGAWEIAESANFTNGNIQTIQKYVNENKLNPLATFAWHMPWAIPTDPELLAMYPKEPNSHKNNYAKYGNDRTVLYNAITKCVTDHIVPDETFTFIIPTGTTLQNAWTSYLTEKDIHRDYGHATDLCRVMASYTWYCKLMGIEKLDSIKLDAIPKRFFKSTVAAEDRVLTQAEKDLILECVNNALANPLQVTQSQYTQAPA